MFNRLVKYFLDNRLVTFIFLIVFVFMGLVTMPFNLKSGLLPRDPVPVDAIPDIGENQQIVATEWMGRSPKDIHDQLTYPLTTALLGIPGVQTIRSTSMFGMSFIYIIFKDNVEFYWSRSRILRYHSTFATWYLSVECLPLGAHNSELVNFLFVAGIVAAILIALMSLVHFYEKILRWALLNKWKFQMIPAFTLFFGLLIWQGAVKAFPGTGKEFMPSLNEGSFLLMPTSMPHSSIEKNLDYIETLDKRLSTIPEVEVVVGGMTLSISVEGRERFPLRVRYARELRDNPEDLKRILVPAMNGVQIPLGEIADISYTRGAQMIRSENTFLVGITYKFAGNYEHQLQASKRLAIVVPLSLIVILLLLYFQFRTVIASFIHFSGVLVAFSGGFIMIWLYGQDWFMNLSVVGLNLRDMFQMHTINLSVAVWVGFIALFGIATNDGVIMGTYIHHVFEEIKPATVHDVREAVVLAGKKRVRPAMMTTAVAVIALLPVLSSTGKGADIMVPMAIPAFGGMIIQVMTIFVVPLLQAMWRENRLK